MDRAAAGASCLPLGVERDYVSDLRPTGDGLIGKDPGRRMIK